MPLRAMVRRRALPIVLAGLLLLVGLPAASIGQYRHGSGFGPYNSHYPFYGYSGAYYDDDVYDDDWYYDYYDPSSTDRYDYYDTHSWDSVGYGGYYDYYYDHYDDVYGWQW